MTKTYTLKPEVEQKEDIKHKRVIVEEQVTQKREISIAELENQKAGYVESINQMQKEVDRIDAEIAATEAALEE